MRYIVPFLLATALTAQTSWRGTSNDWSPFHNDKGTHIWAGAMIGALAYVTADKLGYKHPWAHAIFWAALAAYLKERYDLKHGGRPEYADAAWTVGGSAGISFLLWKSDPARKPEFATAPK